ncbi:MAG: hypothetical protein K6V97_13460 [Actinomycetia bacterium]|nr:hypothetical protein [Actinomycetes bacterium]
MGDPTTGWTVAGAEAASAVLANAGVALLMRTAIGVELDLLAQTFQLTPAERQFVQDAPEGQGFLIVGQARGTRRVPVEILATDGALPVPHDAAGGGGGARRSPGRTGRVSWRRR